MIKFIKNLGLTYPSSTDVIKTSLISMGIMVAGGTFLFLIDTATMYLFSVTR